MERSFVYSKGADGLPEIVILELEGEQRRNVFVRWHDLDKHGLVPDLSILGDSFKLIESPFVAALIAHEGFPMLQPEQCRLLLRKLGYKDVLAFQEESMT